MFYKKCTFLRLYDNKEHNLIYCKNPNSRKVKEKWCGLFQDSAATEIVILSCGKNITDMSCMFYDCSNLEKLILWETEMNKVYRMYALFRNCFVKKGNIICTGSMLKKIQNENYMPKIIRYISFITGTITGLEFEKEDSHNANYVDVQKYKCTIQNNKILTVETVEERVGGV